MHNNLLRKMLIIGTIVLFAGSITVPCITGQNNQVKLKQTYTQAIPFNPFLSGWWYRNKITIDYNQVAGDLNDFPVLINIIDSGLANKAQNDGDDILFMDDKGKANQLCHEIEYFDSLTGELVAWVKIPYVSSNSDTIFYMYYGNKDCTNQQLPEDVWNTNYCAVWHLHEDPTGLIHDSTSNNNDGFSYGQMSSTNLVDGKIGKCIDFDGINDYIAILDSTSLKPEEVTLIGWFKPLEQYPPYGFFLSKKCHDYYGNADGHTYGFCWRENDTLQGGIEQRLSSPNQWAKIGNYPISIYNWYYLVLTFDEDKDTGIFYVNGIEEARKTSLHSSALWYNQPWDFLMGASRMHEGSSHAINDWFKCQLDEVRVINNTLTADWITTEYNNQNNPSGFYTYSHVKTKQKVYDNLLFHWFLERFPLIERLLTFLLL